MDPGGCHAIGAVLLFLAVRQQTFRGLFLVMLLYSLCYAATLPLVNSVLFAHVSDLGTQGLVFIWAPVAWALVGYSLTGWRNVRGGEGDGSDCLMLAAVLSVLMAVACYLARRRRPQGATEIPIVKAFGMLAQPDFLIFMITSMVVAGMMQFYFLGSARFMIDMGISGKNVPATMGIAQAAQAVATFFLLGIDGRDGGLQMDPDDRRRLLVAHVLDLRGHQAALVDRRVADVPRPGLRVFHDRRPIFAGKVGPHIPASMQALIFAATTGVGLFFGTQLAGIVMDRFSVEGQFQWRKIWAVPMLIMAAATWCWRPCSRPVPPPEAAPAAELPAAEITVAAS